MPRKQQIVAQVLGFLLPTQETCIRVPSSWLCPDPIMVTVGIRKVNQWMEDQATATHPGREQKMTEVPEFLTSKQEIPDGVPGSRLQSVSIPAAIGI